MSLASDKIKARDEIEYQLNKLHAEKFAQLSDGEKRIYRAELAQIRIAQIERNPHVYPDGVTGNLRQVAAQA